MAATGARLGIDISRPNISAVVCTAGGVRLPLLLDGALTMPAGVFVTPDTGAFLPGAAGLAAAHSSEHCYVPDPAALLGDALIVVGEHTVAPVDLLAAVLAHAAAASRAAGVTVATVCLAVPPEWGPRRRHLSADAAVRAGFPRPDLMAAPVAVAHHLYADTGLSTPPETCLLVCDAEPAATRLNVLQHTGGTYTVLATRAVPVTTANGDWQPSAGLPSVGAPVIVVPQQGGLRLPHDAAILTQPTTPSARPGPRNAEPNDGTGGFAPADFLTGSATREVLQAADVEPERVTAAILAGSAAAQPGLADALSAATAQTVLIPTNSALAAADGATRAPTTPTPAAAANLVGPAGPRRWIRLLVGPFLLASASLALLIRALLTADTNYVNTFISWVDLPTEQLAAAGLLGMLTALASGHAITAAALTDSGDWRATAVAARRAYTASALLGGAAAVLYGMLTGTYVHQPASLYLTGLVLAATPPAVAALTMALLAGRVPTTEAWEWLARVRVPVGPAMLAAAGLLLVNYAYFAPTSAGFGLIGPAGTALLGVAIAATLTHRPALRAISASILGIGAAAVYNAPNARILATAYLWASAWWAATILIATIRYAFPRIDRTLPRTNNGMNRSG